MKNIKGDPIDLAWEVLDDLLWQDIDSKITESSHDVGALITSTISYFTIYDEYSQAHTFTVTVTPGVSIKIPPGISIQLEDK